jgi:hypothetical protein
MTKYWMTVTMEKDVPVALFLETDDSAVEVDLERSFSSIIRYALMGCDVDTVLKTTPEGDKQELFARCVFKYVCATKDLGFNKMIEVTGIPRGLEHYTLGGSADPGFPTCAAVIHRCAFPNL